MPQLDDLLPQILLFAPNCPEIVAIQYARDAARQFARDSRLWVVSLGTADVSDATDADAIVELALAATRPNPVPIGDAAPNFLVPPDATIYTVTRVMLDDDDAEEFPALQLRTLRQTFEYDRVTETLRLDPAFVSHDGIVTVWAALQPTLTATTVPAVFGDYDEAIRNLAIHNILHVPGRDWSNPQAAVGFYRRYQHQLARANARRHTDLPLRAGHIAFV